MTRRNKGCNITNLSTLVISELNHFVQIRDFWDQELKDHIDDPFLFSSLIIEQWKLNQQLGCHPFLLIFLSEKKIVGFAPLLIKTRFGFRYVSSFDSYTCPEFFQDNLREKCVDQIVNILFRQLNCKSADINFRDEPANQRIVDKVCRNRNLNYTLFPQEGRAIIPVRNSLDSFRRSLNRKNVKEFGRLHRKLDKLGPWQISNFDLYNTSIIKIWEVESHSWKAKLKGKRKGIKDLGLSSILKGVKRNQEGKPYFESEVWFLELNNKPIAYVLTMKRNKTEFFAKTSFDSRFKDVSPGIILMNYLIERIFVNKVADKIDFISNLSFVQVWKPLVEKRIYCRILRNVVLSRFRNLVFENRIIRKTSQILENIKWKKRNQMIANSRIVRQEVRPL